MVPRNGSRPSLEALERRLTPAGNVTASLSGEVLQLRGDEAANCVRITQTGSTIRIERCDGTTTINGRAFVVFNGSGLVKTDLRLFGGHDTLDIRGLRTSVDQNVEMGAGNDVVALSNVTAGVNLSVKTDDGTDRVTANGVRTGGDFYLETGQGNSSVAITGSSVGKTLTVIGKNGADVVGISGVTTGEDLNVEVGEGNDRVGLTNVRSTKNLKVDAGVGNDYVAVRNVNVAKDAVFLGEDGFDTFENRGVWAREKLEIKGFDRFV